MKKSTIRKITDYFLLTYLIAVTGFPFFYSDIEFFILGFLMPAAVFLMRKPGTLTGIPRPDKTVVLVFGAFLLVEVLQSLYFGLFEVKTFIGTLMRLGAAYFTMAILLDRFYDYYVKIIYFFSVISLMFFIPALVIPGFADFFTDNVAPFFVSPFHTSGGYYETSPNIIIYTFEKSLFVSSRNSGPFWEPGAFSIFLVLAMMFRLVQVQNIFDKKVIFFAVVVLTTTSTSGYIALFLLVVSYYVFNRRVNALKYVLIAMMVYGASLAYVQLEFLEKKAKNDIALASETTTSRFGSALVDLQDFVKNPLIGYGRGSNRYGGKQIDQFTSNFHRNNGITQLLVTYGIFIFLIYFYVYYRNFYRFCKDNAFNVNFALAMLLILMIMGFSQGIFTKPFFYGLLFIVSTSNGLRSLPHDKVSISDIR
ncbi:MAG: hypothetical protein ACI85F_000294 [Bacteroidia bacterium]|jgi:hypothetical protein